MNPETTPPSPQAPPQSAEQPDNDPREQPAANRPQTGAQSSARVKARVTSVRREPAELTPGARQYLADCTAMGASMPEPTPAWGVCSDCGAAAGLDCDCPKFGDPGCTCVPFTRQTDPPRYLNRPTDTVDMIGGWERGRDCPHHAPSTPAPISRREQVVDAIRNHKATLNLGGAIQFMGSLEDLADAVLREPAIAEALAAVAAVERVRTVLDRDQDGLCCSHVTGQIRAALDQQEQQ